MKRQLDAFCAALLYCTRIPIRRNIPYTDHLLQHAARYFPWIGILTGGMAAFTWIITYRFLSPDIAVFLAIITTLLITGASHENSFGVVCHAFSKGWSKERIIALMEENRLDTTGLIGLGSSIAFKFLLLRELEHHVPVATFTLLLIAGHSSSCLSALTLQQQYPYITDAIRNNAAPPIYRKLSFAGLSVAIAGGLLPFTGLHYKVLLVLLPVTGMRWYLGRYFHKWLGGYANDCYGTVQQASEVVFYTGCIVVWKYL